MENVLREKKSNQKFKHKNKKAHKSNNNKNGTKQNKIKQRSKHNKTKQNKLNKFLTAKIMIILNKQT